MRRVRPGEQQQQSTTRGVLLQESKAGRCQEFIQGRDGCRRVMVVMAGEAERSALCGPRRGHSSLVVVMMMIARLTAHAKAALAARDNSSARRSAPQHV